jgi:energy-coupling factor transporter ATP-binding protein EcfA2
MSNTITLQRANGQKTNDDTIREQVDYIVSRGLAGERGKTWDVEISRKPPYQADDLKWVFTFVCEFTKCRGKKGDDVEGRQWDEIEAMIEQTGTGTRYGKYPWVVLSKGHNETEPLPGSLDSDSPHVEVVDEKNKLLPGVHSVLAPEEVPDWSELHIPPELLDHNSSALAEHPCFSHLYGLDPQLRTLLHSVQGAVESGGEQRDHAVLWGHAGCGKTTTLLALEKLLPPGSVLRLDATSTTKAGIEDLIFKQLPVVPPIVICEEVEKADENALKIWLGALDDRGEIRKIIFKKTNVRAIKVLFLCTVNNKRKFDMMMGSDGKEAGALSSRCVTDVYFPRPKRETLRRILNDRINGSGGKPEWVDPALNLGEKLGYTDPRKVRSLLAGGDRLMDNSYQDDRMAIHTAQVEDHKETPEV